MPVSGHPPHTTTACGAAPGGSTKMSRLDHKLLRLKTPCSANQAFAGFLSTLGRRSRSCSHLVFVLFKLSFGMLTFQRFPFRTGDWSNVDGTPITQCP
jgi:hypothetical protein